MTGRLVRPSTIDLRDYWQKAEQVSETTKPRTGRGFVGGKDAEPAQRLAS
jgi:hypothetical protein